MTSFGHSARSGHFDALPGVVVELDRDGRVRAIGGGHARAFSSDGDEWIGRSAFEIWKDNLPLVDAVRRALDGAEVSRELSIGRGWWRISWAPLPGDRAGAIGMAMPVEAKTAPPVEQHAAFVESVIENIPDMIFVKDGKDLKFVRFNRAGEELLGYSKEELIGRNDYDFFPAEEADFFTAKDRDVLESGRLLEISEEAIHTRNKGTRILHTKKIPIYDRDGRPAYLLGISEDITDRKAVERERHELGERQRELGELRARLLANVSHDFRTPLTLILAALERLRAEPLTLTESVDSIERNARVLLHLVTDLVDAARLEARATAPDYAEVDLVGIVRSTVASFEALFSQRELDVVVDAPGVLFAQVDPDMIRRILTNLLGNAVKFTPECGKIRVGLSRTSDRASILVADSGPGVPEAIQDHVFERFVQGASPGGGTGLGLAIVKELTDLHRGSVSVGKGPEGGAAFQIDLPLRAPIAALVRDADERESVSIVPPYAVGEPRREEASLMGDPAAPLVLVVEDNVEMNRYLAVTLAQQFRVATAYDGSEGLSRAVELLPDLVVTDLMMPTLGGEALVEALRSRTEFATLPILVLTAKSGQDVRTHLLEQGVQDYLAKPFAPRELAARVRHLVDVKRARELLTRELAERTDSISELAERLAHRSRSLEAALTTAEVAREEAEKAARVRVIFLAMVAHEIRTPATVLKLRLEQIERKARAHAEVTANELRQVATAATRLYTLVESLLEYARLESGNVEVHPEAFDLGELAALVVEEFQPQAQAKNLGLTVSPVSRGGPMLESDPRLVRLVLANLIGNAVKFTRQGSIDVEVSFHEGTHRLRVTDTGPGIPASARARVFVPFEQVASLGEKHLPGIGLGLALVTHLLDALGGTVKLESEEGRGSVFTATLPALGTRVNARNLGEVTANSKGGA